MIGIIRFSKVFIICSEILIVLVVKVLFKVILSLLPCIALSKMQYFLYFLCNIEALLTFVRVNNNCKLIIKTKFIKGSKKDT